MRSIRRRNTYVRTSGVYDYRDCTLFTARAEVKMPFNYLRYHWEVVLTMQQQQARDVERAFGLDPASLLAREILWPLRRLSVVTARPSAGRTAHLPV